jgi:hypothetical protein
MSRGPGRIERAIRALLDANPDRAFTTDELCEHCYPVVAIEKKHMVAVLRAAMNVLKADPDWTAERVWGDKGNRYRFFNRDSVVSRATPMRPHTRFRPVEHEWQQITYRGYGRVRRKVPKAEREARIEGFYAEHPEQKAAAQATIDRLHAKADERHADDVAWHRLLRDSDVETRERLEAALLAIWRRGFEVWGAWQKERRTWMTKPDQWLKRYQDRAAKEPATVNDRLAQVERLAARAREGLNEMTALRSQIGQLAAKTRALLAENDPDAVRAGLRQIADAQDWLAHGVNRLE